jgi:hypothetical protein
MSFTLTKLTTSTLMTKRRPKGKKKIRESSVWEVTQNLLITKMKMESAHIANRLDPSLIENPTFSLQ